MFKAQTVRHVVCAINPSHAIRPMPSRVSAHARGAARWLCSTPSKCADGSKEDPYRSSSTAANSTDKHAHEGSFSRTDREVSFEYPDEQSFPRSKIVQGRGGPHMKRTLPSFSMEGKVAVVTGGARGIGLTLSQALMASGADVALVDMNSAYFSTST